MHLCSGDTTSDYSKLGTVSAEFLTAKIVEMTTTTTEKQPNYNHTKFEYERFMEYYKGTSILTQSNVDQFDSIFSPIADELTITNVKN